MLPERKTVPIPTAALLGIFHHFFTGWQNCGRMLSTVREKMRKKMQSFYISSLTERKNIRNPIQRSIDFLFLFLKEHWKWKWYWSTFSDTGEELAKNICEACPCNFLVSKEDRMLTAYCSYIFIIHKSQRKKGNLHLPQSFLFAVKA